MLVKITTYPLDRTITQELLLIMLQPDYKTETIVARERAKGLWCGRCCDYQSHLFIV